MKKIGEIKYIEIFYFYVYDKYKPDYSELIILLKDYLISLNNVFYCSTIYKDYDFSEFNLNFFYNLGLKGGFFGEEYEKYYEIREINKKDLKFNRKSTSFTMCGRFNKENNENAIINYDKETYWKYLELKLCFRTGL